MMTCTQGLILTSLLVVMDVCHADTALADTAPAPLWIHAGALSYHPNLNKNYNGNNVGLGLEYHWQPTLSLMAGGFCNSLRQDSVYIAVGYQPWTTANWRWGMALGVLNGYNHRGRQQVFPMGLPMASLEGERFGLNIGLIPDIPSAGVDGALVIQLKLRLK